MSLTGDWRRADNKDNNGNGRAFSRSDEEFSLELGGSVSHRINNNMQQGKVHKVRDCNFAKIRLLGQNEKLDPVMYDNNRDIWYQRTWALVFW